MLIATVRRRSLTVLSAALMALPIALVPSPASAAVPEAPQFGIQEVCDIVDNGTPFYYDWRRTNLLGYVNIGQKFNTISYHHGGYDGRLWGREWEVVWISGTHVGCWV